MTNETTNVPADSTEDPQSPMPPSDSGAPPTAPDSGDVDANTPPTGAAEPEAPEAVSAETPDAAPAVDALTDDGADDDSAEAPDEPDEEFDEFAAAEAAHAAAQASKAAAEAEADAAEMRELESRDWYGTMPNDWATWCAFRDQINESVKVRQSFLNWLSNHADESAQAFKAGLGRCAAGQFSRAESLVSQENSPLAKYLTGYSQKQIGKHAEAVQTWNSINDASEVGARARLALVDYHFATRDTAALESAVQAVKKAGDAPAHQAFADGALAESSGDHQGAMDAWERAIEADETHAEATFRLAELLDLFGDDEAACELYDRFRSGALPPQVGALMNLGTLHEDAGNHPWATTCFQMVVNADPENDRARRFLENAQASSIQYYDESRERSADKQNAVLRIPVTDFELSVRARNCLQRMNIHTLGDLVSRTESELLSFKNFGETSLQEVKDILLMKGLRLGMMPSMDVGPAASAATAGPAAGTGDVMEILISELDLSVRSRAALAMLGITRVRELTQANETTLMSCKNFGQTSLDEIRSKLRNLGLEIAR